MKVLPNRFPRHIFALIAISGLLFVGISQGEEPAGQPSVADLEKRIKDLEEIVRKLQAERPPSATIPIMHQPEGPPDAGAAPLDSDGPGVGQGGVSGGGSGGGVRSQVPGPGGRSPSDVGIHLPDWALAGWDDGFLIRSQDKKYVLRITGQIQNDYRDYPYSRDITDVDSFLVRRARLGVEADMGVYEFRLLPDFSNKQNPSTPATTVIQDAYVNAHWFDAFQLEGGKFKQPFSYEQLIQDRFVPTVERSLIDQFVPARDVGLMIHGRRLLGGRFDYYASVANGEINGDFDTNDRKDVNLRAVFRPFQETEWLKGLQGGFSYSTGIEQGTIFGSQTAVTNDLTALTLRTPAQIPWFKFNNIAAGTGGLPANVSNVVIPDGARDRISPEVVYFYKGLGLAAQYYHQRQDARISNAGPGELIRVDFPVDGYYVLATYLLTGEERTTYSQAITPLHDFDICHPLHCCGAWELVARVSRADLGSQVFQPFIIGTGVNRTILRLADPTLWTQGVTEMTVGFNWYWTKWVRWQFNWEHDYFDNPVNLGQTNTPKGLLKHDDALLTRLQLIF
jgi:phosphate-selective porin OprO/OprP